MTRNKEEKATALGWFYGNPASGTIEIKQAMGYIGRIGIEHHSEGKANNTIVIF
ncbi:hypothetical protein [Chitinophaga sp. CF418]|uniref:hypothetical protein n=1 Tax=Chitinophaga sp. CF418 TaxID=1855287 RepID=UPI00165ED4CE|nr:hypothetical protein [Chitinophaga sp. CF418]